MAVISEAAPVIGHGCWSANGHWLKPQCWVRDALTPALSRREREPSSFSLGEKVRMRGICFLANVLVILRVYIPGVSRHKLLKLGAEYGVISQRGEVIIFKSRLLIFAVPSDGAV